MTNIFVANLDFGITSEDLKATFSQFGTVSYAHVVYDNKTKKSKGFGYVEMDNPMEADAAINALNGIEVAGRALDIKIATPKNKRAPSQDKNKPKENPQKSQPRSTKNIPKRSDTGKRRVLRKRKKKD